MVAPFFQPPNADSAISSSTSLQQILYMLMLEYICANLITIYIDMAAIALSYVKVACQHLKTDNAQSTRVLAIPGPDTVVFSYRQFGCGEVRLLTQASSSVYNCTAAGTHLSKMNLMRTFSRMSGWYILIM